jgi:hypothetical protein
MSMPTLPRTGNPITDLRFRLEEHAKHLQLLAVGLRENPLAITRANLRAAREAVEAADQDLKALQREYQSRWSASESSA